jgi:hypothetical protein
VDRYFASADDSTEHPYSSFQPPKSQPTLEDGWWEGLFAVGKARPDGRGPSFP